MRGPPAQSRGPRLVQAGDRREPARFGVAASVVPADRSQRRPALAARLDAGRIDQCEIQALAGSRPTQRVRIAGPRGSGASERLATYPRLLTVFTPKPTSLEITTSICIRAHDLAVSPGGNRPPAHSIDAVLDEPAGA